MQNIRESIEKMIITTLLFESEHNDNPFDIEELQNLVNNIDINLFKNKHCIFLLKAMKKLNENKVVVTIKDIESYLEINAPKWLNYLEECEVMVLTCSPTTISVVKEYLKTLKDYNKKDKLAKLGI